MTNHEPKHPTADMAGLIKQLEFLSSTHGEHMCDGDRLTEFCHAGRKAATQLQALAQRVKVLEAENERLRDALKGVLAQRYGEWCDIARTALKGTEQ